MIFSTILWKIHLIKNLDKQKIWYDYYNVGSEDWFSVNEIAEIYEKEIGLSGVIHRYTGGSKGWYDFEKSH